MLLLLFPLISGMACSPSEDIFGVLVADLRPPLFVPALMDFEDASLAMDG